MNLEEEYYFATECQLATLEQLVERAASSKADIDRQYRICFDMLLICSKLAQDVSAGGTRLSLIMGKKGKKGSANPLRSLYEFACDHACDPQKEFVASIPYGGYNNEDEEGS